MAVWLNLIPQLHQPGDEDVSMRHHHFRERGEEFYAGKLKNKILNFSNSIFFRLSFHLGKFEIL